MRQGDQSLEVAELVIKYQGAGVVGFDLAGPEEGHPPSRHREALELLAENHIPTTIHAGEEGDLESVNSAIFARALRLGHGTRLAEDFDVEDDGDMNLLVELGDTAQWVLDREITLECCPSSNVQTGASPWGEELADHPFDVMYQLGMRVTVNTDNRLMSDTTLSTELALLVDTFGYDLDDLFQFQLNAAIAAFLPLDERKELIEMLEDGFEDFEDDDTEGDDTEDDDND